MFLILLFSPLIIRELTNYNNIYCIYISALTAAVNGMTPEANIDSLGKAVRADILFFVALTIASSKNSIHISQSLSVRKLHR